MHMSIDKKPLALQENLNDNLQTVMSQKADSYFSKKEEVDFQRKMLYVIIEEEIKEKESLTFSFGKKSEDTAETEISIDDLKLKHLEVDPFSKLFELTEEEIKKLDQKKASNLPDFVIENGEKILIPKRKSRVYDVNKFVKKK